MNSSLEHLAAVAAAAVPGLLPVSVGPSPDDDADFRSAVVADSSDRRWRVRSPRTAEAALRLAAEHSVLRGFSPALRARLPFHIPTVAGSIDDDGRRTLVYTHLPGAPVPIDDLMDLGDAAPTRPQPPSAQPVPPVAVQLGSVIAAIHGLPRAMVMDADLPAYSAEQCRRRMLNELDQAATTGRIPAALLRRWESALEDRTLWRFSTHVVHGDLHEDNLVVHGNRVTAVTGWSDVHVGDPATDLAWLIGASDPAFAEAVAAAYTRARGVDPDPHLLRRAHLEAEFALARWLVRGLSRDLPDLVQDAEHMLRVLEKDAQEYERRQRAAFEPHPEESVDARTEHARQARERAAAGPVPGSAPEQGAAPGPDAATASEPSGADRVGLDRAAAEARARLSGDLLDDDPLTDDDAAREDAGPGATVTPLRPRDEPRSGSTRAEL